MIRKFLLIICTLLLLFSTVVINDFLQNSQHISTFKAHVIPELKISNQTIENYYSSNASLSLEAKKSIIISSLKNLKYEHWLNYTDYIDIQLYKQNVLPDCHDELLVVLNLSKDSAVIAIYKYIDNAYIFSNVIENLSPIQNISFLKVPEFEQQIIVTEQLLDERLGGFFIERFLTAFLFAENEFKEVWKKNKYSEEIYNARWVNPNSDPNHWIKVIERNFIEFIEQEKPVIDVSVHREKLEAFKSSMPTHEEFKKIEDVLTRESYYWSPKYLHFVIKEGTHPVSSEPIAIIEDTQNSLEAFIGIQSFNYKILTQDREILYINKNSIILNP